MKNLDTYSRKFYQNQLTESRNSARYILPIINQWFKPKSVIDVGCGVGAWLKTWREFNTAIDIIGLDSSFVDKAQMLIDTEKEFLETDLNNALPKLKKYDLAMSLEVAEHLEERRASTFIEDLTKLSDIVVFSAAIPGQEGTQHINEQFLGYWIDKFEKNNYKCYDIIRPLIWDKDTIAWWFRQNMVVFVNKSIETKIDLSALQSFNCNDLVQKELLIYKTKKYKTLEKHKNENLGFKTILKKIIQKCK